MKAMNLILVVLFTLSLGCTNAQTKNNQEKTSDDKISQVRDVSGYSRIDVSEGIKVTLSLGDKEYVEVFANNDIIDDVITEVNGNTLSIHMSNRIHNMRNRQVEVNVIAKKVDGIDASSGSSLSSQGIIKSDNLDLSVSSGASLDIELDASSTSCDASSGAHANLKGTSPKLKAEASSGSGIDANELKASVVKADVSSGARISISVSDELNAEASSGGSIRYTGSPKVIDVEKSSGGSIKKS